MTRRKKPDPNVYRANTNLAAYPYFTLDERDRRWTLVREAMDRERLDCLVIPPDTSPDGTSQACARYLTHVGGGGVQVAAVFPLLREPSAITLDAALWSQAQPWCTDLREAHPSFASVVLGKLGEVSLRRRRIGVVGLSSLTSTPGVPSSFVDTLTRALPRTTWVDFTPRLDEIRSVKSTEEIAFLERASTIVDAAYETAVEWAIPADSQRSMQGKVVESLVTLGGELPTKILWSSGWPPGALGPDLMDVPILSGQLFLSEIEASWGGYRARGARPFAAGKPAAIYIEMMDAIRDTWPRVLAQLRPGARLDDLQELTRMQVAGSEIKIVIEGCGLGSDAPRLGIRHDLPGPADRVIEPGWCFSVLIQARTGEHRISWANSVVMSRRGPRLLSPAKPTLLIRE